MKPAQHPSPPPNALLPCLARFGVRRHPHRNTPCWAHAGEAASNAIKAKTPGKRFTRVILTACQTFPRSALQN
jgi:hypothetical protein